MTDANILVAGIGWPHFPYEVLQHATKGDFNLVLSETIVAEARYSLAKIEPSAINLGDFERFLKATRYDLIPAPSDEDIAAHQELVRDPNDIHVALAARNAKVDMLMTLDTAFTDVNESTKKVRALLTIITPGKFLRNYMGWTSEQLEVVRLRGWKDLTP